MYTKNISLLDVKKITKDDNNNSGDRDIICTFYECKVYLASILAAVLGRSVEGG